jgi:aminoglycoside phosphotransferase family enzyme
VVVLDEPYVTVAETHTGAVLFVGDLAYKIKKPVSLGFVDWTDRAARVSAIETELALNRRLTPDVYLGTGTLPVPDGQDEPVLVMRRLPSDRRLSTLVRRGDDVDPVLRHLAHQLAAFHLETDMTDAAMAAASAAATRERWEINHERLRPWFGTRIDRSIAEEVLGRAHRYIDGRHPLFQQRIRDGWARDGHGDLLAQDVFCLDDGPRVLDCLDFDEHLRVGDVLADIAFLAMDLERLGRPDLGWRLLELHREMTADTWPESLAHHHIAYRAQVRTLVSCVRADQGDRDAGDDAAVLLALAARHLSAGRVRLILVGGSPGTGKSTLAAGIGDVLGAPVLRSDELRKELVGLPTSATAAADLDGGIYTPAWTERTYTELLDRAKRLVELGETVVLDATWAEETHRASARATAESAFADVVELRCVADDETARRRAAIRNQAGGDASDADAAVATAVATRFGPWPQATEISTMSTTGVALANALSALDGRRLDHGPIGSASPSTP